MKKQFIYLALFPLFSNLQAGRNKQNQRSAATEQNSTGSSSLLPVNQVDTEQDLHIIFPIVRSESAVDDFDNVWNTAASSHTVSPINNIPRSSRRFAESPVPAIGCQTTRRVFNEASRPQTPLASRPISPLNAQSGETQDIFTEELGSDMVIVREKSAIERLQEVISNNQTITQKAREQLYQLSHLAQNFTERSLCSELSRILNLRSRGELSKALEVYEADADKGAFLAKGLDQAVQSKNVDKTTEMLEVIHLYNLKEFVPTNHQDSAAELLLAHNKKITTQILPVTLRTSNPGDLSPRSKAACEMLKSIYCAYNQKPNTAPESSKEVSKEFAANLLQQLKELEK